MSNLSSKLSETRRTDEAIFIIRKHSNAKMFEDYTVEQERNEKNYIEALELEAQSIRSEKLETTGNLVSTVDSLLEVQREQLSQIVYFNTLEK